MECAILKDYDLMIGLDPHGLYPTLLTPVATVAIAHFVSATIGLHLGVIPAGSKDEHVDNMSGKTMVRGTDRGPWIPHIPFGPNAKAPLLMLSSSSKTYFGVTTVVTKKGPVAVASFVMVGQNFNCAEMPPAISLNTPTGLVFSLPSLNFAGMSWGDAIAAGLFIGVDLLTGWVSSKVCGYIKDNVVAKLVVLVALAIATTAVSLHDLKKRNPTWEAAGAAILAGGTLSLMTLVGGGKELNAAGKEFVESGISTLGKDHVSSLTKFVVKKISGGTIETDLGGLEEYATSAIGSYLNGADLPNYVQPKPPAQ